MKRRAEDIDEVPQPKRMAQNEGYSNFSRKMMVTILACFQSCILLGCNIPCKVIL
jgi:hypothetical protein